MKERESPSFMEFSEEWGKTDFETETKARKKKREKKRARRPHITTVTAKGKRRLRRRCSVCSAVSVRE